MIFKPRFVIYIFLFTFYILLYPSPPLAEGDELSEIEKEISEKREEYYSASQKLAEIRKQKEEISDKLTELEGELSATETELNSIENQIYAIQTELDIVEENLGRSQQRLKSQVNLRNRTIREFYKKEKLTGLELFLSGGNFLKLAQTSSYQKSFLDEAKKVIEGINTEIAEYEKNRKELSDLRTEFEGERQRIAAIRNSVAQAAAEAQNQVDELSSQQDVLSGELSEISRSLSDLTSQQKEILRAKFGATEEGITVGNYALVAESMPDPSFTPAFAFFTYGYPHRVGMNQYGALGRAKAGQSADDILHAYYAGVEIEGDCDKDKRIPVSGYGEISLEDEYLKGIGEMPNSWADEGGMEALKAQAIAARSYALNYIYHYWDSDSGEIKDKEPVSICTSQSCQVYLGSPKGGAWDQAVEDTCGKVVTYGGKPITAWYASTYGGYSRASADVWGSSRPWAQRIRDWDCSEGLFSCAYDGPSHGDSPWFHKAWGDTPRGDPWLTEEETEDIFNAYLLSEKDSGYNQHLSPEDQGGWSKEEVKDALHNEGLERIEGIEDIVVVDDGEGYIDVVHVTYSGGSKDFDGYKFRSIYNLRSPGTLVIWTSFFDVGIER